MPRHVVSIIHSYILIFEFGNQFMKQRAAGQIPASGKVKGLFCSLSRNSIYSFCVYGLHTQANIVKSDNMNNVESNANFLPDIFHLPWFSSELSGSTEVIRVSDKTNKESNRDSFKCKNNDCNADFGSNADTNESKPRGTAENLAKTNFSQYLRFSKYSNPSIASSSKSASKSASKSKPDWKDNDEDQLRDDDEGGNILTLCRVLLKKTLSIEDDIANEDIQIAFLGGYDSIFSKTRSGKFSSNLLSTTILMRICLYVDFRIVKFI